MKRRSFLKMAVAGGALPLVKTVLLGNVLAQTGKCKLMWDGHRVTNNEGANAFVKATYRRGWELPLV